MSRLKNFIFNLCIALNSLLLFLLLFEDALIVPSLLHVGGRMHPLLLHFPIALLVLVVVWEIIVTNSVSAEKENIGDWFLLAALFTAVLAASMGLLLSLEEGYDAESIALHKWTGAGVAFISLLWYAFRHFIRKHPWVNRSMGVVTLILITLAGHEGASITHGDNFLFEPLALSPTKAPVILDDAFTYEHVVRPILEEKCFSCHSHKKAKGELVMDTEELLLKGGKSGKLWDSNSHEDGLLLKRIHLSSEDKEHMPPTGKPQLSDEEIRVLNLWIKRGASLTQKVTSLPVDDSLRKASMPFLSSIETDTYSFEAADDALVKKLNNDYRVVQPLALHSPALHVEFFGATFFKPEQLQELHAIKEQIISLNLNRMPVKDEDLRLLASFTHLRKLNLSFTDITGATLESLRPLKELRQLSLSGTNISEAHLGTLKALPKLSTLYVWSTPITLQETQSLHSALPNVQIESGYRGDSVLVKLSPPIIEGSETIFSKEAVVTLRHYIKGTVLRYTTDGSEPDSLSSPVYSSSGIVLRQNTQLKTKAYLKGWLSSSVSSKNYFKAGYIPDSVQLLTLPNAQYKGFGGASLFDGRLGTVNFRAPNWLGYRENGMKTILSFTHAVSLSSVTFSSLIDINSYIFPAAQLEVWSEDDKGKMILLATVHPAMPTASMTPYLTHFSCSFRQTKTKKLMIVAQPVGNLPAWHPGKGDKAWFFVDEVFLN